MRRLRQDLDWIVSTGLLVSVAAAGVSGLVADLWDLNDFWYHTVAGYVMGGFAIAHVLFNWDRLVAYARFRLRRPQAAQQVAPRRAQRATRGAASTSGRPASGLASLAVSRRGLFGLAIGGLGGWAVGRGLRPPPTLGVGTDVGLVYHEWSKPGLLDALGSVANWGQFPALYKSYPDATRFTLAAPRLDEGPPAARTIAARRSTRDYSAQPLSEQDLAQVLFLTTGISAERWGNARRTAPSSGALYPIETYVAVHNVEGIERGVYHYAVREHELELVRPGDVREGVVEQGIGQEFLGECAAVIFLTQVIQRMRPKYQDRSYRYGLLEAGHIGENAYLAAVSLGLGACGIGAFMDDQINEMLGVDGTEEAVVYMLAIGHAA